MNLVSYRFDHTTQFLIGESLQTTSTFHRCILSDGFLTMELCVRVSGKNEEENVRKTITKSSLPSLWWSGTMLLAHNRRWATDMISFFSKMYFHYWMMSWFSLKLLRWLLLQFWVCGLCLSDLPLSLPISITVAELACKLSEPNHWQIQLAILSQ